MEDTMIQVLIFMACTFLLGAAFGWLLFSFGGVKMKKQAETEVEFWRKYSEQNKAELYNLQEENDRLKQKVARSR